MEIIDQIEQNKLQLNMLNKNKSSEKYYIFGVIH